MEAVEIGRVRHDLDFAAILLQVGQWLAIPVYLGIVFALYMAFIYAPTEQVMGTVQRIFYFHVGAAWNAFLAFLLVFVFSVVYLVRRHECWDHLAATGVEIGVVLTTIVLTTGPIWARPVWGTWMPVQDPRVLTTLVLWLMYIAYLVLRHNLPPGEKRARFCAVYGIIAFINVPIVYKSIEWWRTIHPKVITGEGVNLAPPMFHALLAAVGAYLLLIVFLLMLRAAMRIHEASVEALALEDLE